MNIKFFKVIALFLPIFVFFGCGKNDNQEVTQKEEKIIEPILETGKILPHNLEIFENATHEFLSDSGKKFLLKSSVIDLSKFENDNVVITGEIEISDQDPQIISVFLVDKKEEISVNENEKKFDEFYYCSFLFPSDWEFKIENEKVNFFKNSDLILKIEKLDNTDIIDDFNDSVPIEVGGLNGYRKSFFGGKIEVFVPTPTVFKSGNFNFKFSFFPQDNETEEKLQFYKILSDLEWILPETLKTKDLEEEKEFCGGIAGKTCPSGFRCEIFDEKDETGICVEINGEQKINKKNDEKSEEILCGGISIVENEEWFSDFEEKIKTVIELCFFKNKGIVVGFATQETKEYPVVIQYNFTKKVLQEAEIINKEKYKNWGWIFNDFDINSDNIMNIIATNNENETSIINEYFEYDIKKNKVLAPYKREECHDITENSFGHCEIIFDNSDNSEKPNLNNNQEEEKPNLINSDEIKNEIENDEISANLLNSLESDEKSATNENKKEEDFYQNWTKYENKHFDFSFYLPKSWWWKHIGAKDEAISYIQIAESDEFDNILGTIEIFPGNISQKYKKQENGQIYFFIPRDQDSHFKISGQKNFLEDFEKISSGIIF